MKTREETVGENIRRLLIERKSSQLELANSTKISKTTINRAVKGKQLPNSGNLDEIAKFLGVTSADLLGQTQISAQTIFDYIKQLENENRRLKSELSLIREALSAQDAAQTVLDQEPQAKTSRRNKAGR